DFPEQMAVDERPFLHTACHELALRLTLFDDHHVGSFVVAGLQALGELAPRRARVPPAARPAFAATHRVIDRVHRDAAVVRASAEPTASSRFAEAHVLVLDVRHLHHRGATGDVNLPDLAARELDLSVVAVLCHELGGASGRANELPTLPTLELDVVNHRARRDFADRQTVAGS